MCSGVRHSVSTKILTEPPAVRTYSTFLLAIQLQMVRRLTPTSTLALLIEMVFRSGLIASIVILVTVRFRPHAADRPAPAH